MCGICGKLNFEREEPADERLIGRMADAIRHRGPDGSGIYARGPIGLGHRRLSIIDLHTGDQPMCNEDGSVWVVYNGEIYNFAELRAELQQCGHVFKSKTDTEVIVHAYEEWGGASVERFRGMFAFALWDARNELLLLARDRVGVKPLYYVNTGRSLAFASEIKSLLTDPLVPRTPNVEAIDTFLAFQYLPGTQTLMRGIHKLPPGHVLTVKNGHTSIRAYWDLSLRPTSEWASFEQAVEALDRLLHRTVGDHMISDVPVGVLLSGGVDSTGVLSHTIEQTTERVRSFTVGFAQQGFEDERPYARIAADRYGTEHHEMTLTAKAFQEFLPGYVWHMEEPVCEPPAIALYYVAKLARTSGVKVLLSGEGGDEAFAGYKTYSNLLTFEKVKAALGPAKSVLRLGLQALASAGNNSARKYASLVGRPLSSYYRGRTATPFSHFESAGMRLNSSNRYLDELAGAGEGTRRLFEAVPGRSALNHMLYVDTKTWLPDDLLVKADKMTMAASTELRVPLLDYQVLEFAASLPEHFKLHKGSAKRVLKAALGPRVPHEIVNRKKAGFPVPYESWLGTELRDFVSDTLLSANIGLSDYFDQAALKRFVRHARDSGGHPKELFSLLVLEMWHQQFVSTPQKLAHEGRPQQLCAAHE
jgi:asparagine synthase (glutamine-hydrolysing)